MQHTHSKGSANSTSQPQLGLLRFTLHPNPNVTLTLTLTYHHPKHIPNPNTTPQVQQVKHVNPNDHHEDRVTGPSPGACRSSSCPPTTPRLQRNAGEVQGCSSRHVQAYSRCRDARSHPACCRGPTLTPTPTRSALLFVPGPCMVCVCVECSVAAFDLLCL